MSSAEPLKAPQCQLNTREKIREQVQGIYHSNIIDTIKSAGFTKQFGRFSIHLAEEFGFCYGVNRAVELAYETCVNYPDKRIFLTTEIIHNPTVNQNLQDMGIRFLSGPYQSASIDEITQDDVVIIPAFGTKISKLHKLHKTKCKLVDTICGSVIVVWKRVERYAQNGFTSLIHGKFNHEETQATISQVLEYKNGHYLVVLDIEEARYVCDYMAGRGNRDNFMQKFSKCTSPGFDPDVHLEKIGLANQTTMLSSESFEIFESFKKALIDKFGPDSLENYLISFDTICSATQERQDAIVSLKNKNPDLIIVVGGYNSSNTTQLHKIALDLAPSYHINLVDCVIDDKEIRHKPHGEKEEIITKGWLPDGEVSIGITAGASTPNKVMGEIIEKIIAF